MPNMKSLSFILPQKVTENNNTCGKHKYFMNSLHQMDHYDDVTCKQDVFENINAPGGSKVQNGYFRQRGHPPWLHLKGYRYM